MNHKVPALRGCKIELRPVDPIKDCAELYQVSHGDNQWIWEYLFGGPYAGEEEFEAYLKSVSYGSQQQATVGMTVIDHSEATPAKSGSFAISTKCLK